MIHKHSTVFNFRKFSQSVVKSDSGFTLIEIMIAVGLMGVALYVASTMLVNSAIDSTATVDRNAAEISLMKAVLYLRYYLGQAADLKYTTASLDAYSGVDGLIRPYDSAGAAAHATTLAVFNREVGGVLSDPLNPASIRVSTFEQDAIYFFPPMPPSASSPSTTGVLFFNRDKAGVITADYAGQYIPDIVEFSMKNPLKFGGGNANPGDIITSMDVRIVIRYFQPGKDAKVWCPNSVTSPFASSACASVPHRPFRDLEKTLTIKIRNNAVPDPLGDATPLRLLGGVYFFPTHVLR